jgi:hypothetical protein
MQVSEMFSTILRRVLVAFVLLVLIAALQTDSRVHSQNAGNVGIYTREIQVFNAQASTFSSGGIWQCGSTSTPIQCPVLPDNGYAANFLSYCTTGFIGTIDFEWEPPGTSTFLPITSATYGSVAPDTSCRTGSNGLQVGGYYPNLRSTVTVVSGSLSAWYMASAAPISAFPPALGSNGPSAPIACDQNFGAVVANGATGALVGGGTGTATTVICGFTITYNGATSAGSDSLVWSATTGCASPVFGWTGYTTSSTPQTLIFSGLTERNPNGAFSASNRQTPCFVNASGAIANVWTSYAEVPNL